MLLHPSTPSTSQPTRRGLVDYTKTKASLSIGSTCPGEQHNRYISPRHRQIDLTKQLAVASRSDSVKEGQIKYKKHKMSSVELASKLPQSDPISSKGGDEHDINLRDKQRLSSKVTTKSVREGNTVKRTEKSSSCAPLSSSKVSAGAASRRKSPRRLPTKLNTKSPNSVISALGGSSPKRLFVSGQRSNLANEKMRKLKKVASFRGLLGEGFLATATEQRKRDFATEKAAKQLIEKPGGARSSRRGSASSILLDDSAQVATPPLGPSATKLQGDPFMKEMHKELQRVSLHAELQRRQGRTPSVSRAKSDKDSLIALHAKLRKTKISRKNSNDSTSPHHIHRAGSTKRHNSLPRSGTANEVLTSDKRSQSTRLTRHNSSPNDPPSNRGMKHVQMQSALNANKKMSSSTRQITSLLDLKKSTGDSNAHLPTSLDKGRPGNLAPAVSFSRQHASRNLLGAAIAKHDL